jgi:hypothetical protein
VSDFQKDFLHGFQLKGWALQGQRPTKKSGCPSNNKVVVTSPISLPLHLIMIMLHMMPSSLFSEKKKKN